MNEHNGRSDATEKTAFDYLLGTDSEFHPTVSRYLAHIAARMGVPPSRVDFVVAETWLKAVKHRDHFTGDNIKQQLIHWLTIAVRRIAVDVLRRLGKHPCESLSEKEEQLIDEAASQDEESSELREQLEALLDKVLPGNEENVRLVRKHYFEGLSIQELAKESGITTDAVKSRIRRVREEVRELVKSSP